MGRFYRDVIIGGKFVIYDPITELNHELVEGSLAGVLTTTNIGRGTFYRDVIRAQNLVVGNNNAGHILDLSTLIAGGHTSEYTVPDGGGTFYRDTVIGGRLQLGDRTTATEFSSQELFSANLLTTYGDVSSNTDVIDTLDGTYITDISIGSITVVAGTTVAQLLSSIDSYDGSNQFYDVTDSLDASKLEGNLVTEDILVVTAEDLIAQASYTITVSA